MPMRFTRKQKTALEKWDKSMQVQLGNTAALIIKQRVQNDSLGSDGNRLAKYTEITKAKKPKAYGDGTYSYSHGRVRDKGGKSGGVRVSGGREVNRVTLSLTGKMFQQFRCVSSESSRFIARIRPTGGSRAYAWYTNQQRPWMGFSDKDLKLLQDAFDDLWGALQ